MADLPKKSINPGRPFVITKDDTDYLAYIPSKIVVKTGTLTVERTDGTTVALPDMTDPYTWEIPNVVRVLSTGTGATVIVGIT
jgi:hypothetical protein